MKDFKPIILIIITLISFNLNAQNFQWDWLVKGPSSVALITNYTDNLFNSYAVGYFTSSNTAVGSSTYAANLQDGIIIKYDTNGSILWSSSFSGNGAESCAGVSVDSVGNVYVVGYTTSSVVSIGSTTLVGGLGWPDNAMFISKFDVNGNLIYFKTISHGDYINTYGLKICVGSNNIVISNLIPNNNLITFNSNSITAQNDDTYIASFDLNANLNWVNFYSSTGYECILDLSVQKSGDIYFTGTTSSQAFSIGGYTLSGISFSVYAGFIGRMNTSGSLKWVKTFPNANIPNLKIAALSTNSIYLGIGFSSTSLTLGSSTYSSQNYDGLLAQIDSIGNYKWSKLISGNQEESIEGLTVNQNGYIYLAGISSSSVLSTKNYSIANVNTVSNSYFAAFDTRGYDWGLLMSSRPNSTSIYGTALYSISMDTNNNGYLVGNNSNSDLVCGNYTITNSGQNMAFISKIKLLNGVGIQESTFIKDEISIFPNPTTSTLNFDAQTLKFANISILDALGQTVYQKQNSDLSQSLDVSFLKPGIYFVKIQNQLSQKTLKVLKE